MTRLFETRGGSARFNAQRNLMGRTHYVDDDSLGFHKARIIATAVVAEGLLYAIIESVAIDHENRKRGFRYVVFDIFGHVVSRVPLEECSKTSDRAYKALRTWLGGIDAIALTREAADRVERYQRSEMAELRKLLAERERAAA